MSAIDVEVQVGTAPLVDVDVQVEPPTFTVVSVLPTGPRGPAGLTGADGADGDPGPQGDPGEPGADGLVQSVVAGDNITVDATDPANPIVSSTATGGGSVETVNGDAGPDVVLDAADVGAQPVDSDLTAIALLSTTAYGRSLLEAANAAALRTLAGLGTAATTASTDYQPADSDLSAIAALSTTAFGRSFLALANAAALRTLAGLGTAATAATGDFDAAGAASAVAVAAASALAAHEADTTAVHGIANTANLVLTSDSRLSDARTPTTHATSHQDGGTDELALDGSQVTSGTVAEARIDAAIARDSEVTSAVAAEAALARNADNLTSGTVADARIASTIARDSEVAAAYQPLVTNLTTLGGLDSSTSGAIASDGAGWIKKTYAQFKTALGLVKGDVGLGNVDNTADSAKTFAESQITGLVSDLALKAPLASPTFTGTVTVPTPSNGTDAVTKTYADALSQGLAVKGSVFCATTANITLSGEQTIDGQTSSSSRVLVKDQSTGAQNGIYVSASGAWTRAVDMDAATEIPGAFTFVETGTVNAGAGFVIAGAGPYVVGVTAIVWTQFSGAGEITAGNGLGKSGNTLSIDTSVTVDKTTAQTLTNKTLTSPAITTPTGIVKGDVGLGSVDNTADTAKPVSTAQQTALNLKANLASPTFTGTVTIPTGGSITAPTGLVKGDVGLGNVDNTSDANKPVSTAQAAADALKLAIASNLSDLNNAGTARTNLGLGSIATQAANNVSISGGSVTGITDLAIADGGTGQSTAAAAFDALSPVTTRGDIIYRNATANARLAKGTSGQFLTIGANDPAWASIAESDVTNLTTDLTALQTQAAVQAAQVAAQLRAFSGWYVGAGLALSASGTAGKLDMAVGVGVRGTTDLGSPAQTAISTTITSLADATNPKWVALELDSQTVQFNQGTAAASPAIPDFTASRIPLGLLFVPANATAVDALLTTSNGKAKLYDIRQVIPGVSPAGWQYDLNTWTFVSSTTGAGGGLITYKVSGVDVTGYIKKGTKVAWDDGTNTPGYGVVASSTFSTDTTITLIKQSDYVMANATIKYARYSYVGAPQGFPTWFNWSPTLVGWSSDPTNTVYKWKADSTGILLMVRQLTNGTSNAAAHTATMPVAATTISNMAWLQPASATDSGTGQAGQLRIASAGTTMNMDGLIATANNTASGNSRINGQITYEY